MNKELAIECIKTQRQFVDDMTKDAFEMAINTLEGNCSEIPNNWTPCTSDEKPPEGEKVWVSAGKEVTLLRRYGSDWYQDGVAGWSILIAETDAWMFIVIPKPYSLGKEE